MLITLSRRTAVYQSAAEVLLTSVALLGAVSHRFNYIYSHGSYYCKSYLFKYYLYYIILLYEHYLHYYIICIFYIFKCYFKCEVTNSDHDFISNPRTFFHGLI